MPEATPLISTIVGGLVLAFILGALANRLKIPPLVGYQLPPAFSLGHTRPATWRTRTSRPSSPRSASSSCSVSACTGSKDLLSVRGIAVPGAIVQIGFATLLGWGLGAMMGWSTGGKPRLRPRSFRSRVDRRAPEGIAGAATDRDGT